jgi:hypothetical protein
MFNFGSKCARFWQWFQKHEDEIFRFEVGNEVERERLFDKLATQMNHVDSNLTFEFSGVQDGRREFIVSAAGITKAFPQVTALVREAPILPRWKIIAFRQRKDVPSIECGDKTIDRNQIFFDYVVIDNKIDLTLFLPGLANESKDGITGLKTIGYLFLDSTVGEYDVETKVAGIEFVDAAAFAGRRRIPLIELATTVDSLPAIRQ